MKDVKELKTNPFFPDVVVIKITTGVNSIIEDSNSS